MAGEIHSPRKLQGPPTAQLLSLIQGRAAELGDAVDQRRRPWLSGELVEDIDLTTSETDVPHKLGRKPRGWWIVDQDASADIYRSAAATKDFLPLTASAAVTVSLLVF